MMESTGSNNGRTMELLQRLGRNVADIRATCESLGCEWNARPPIVRSDTTDRLFSLEEVAESMEAVLLAWSCDPERTFEPGFDLWDRRALVDLMFRSLRERRT